MQQRWTRTVLGRLMLWCSTGLVGWSTFFPAVRGVHPTPFLTPSRYFEESGHNVGGIFLSFFEKKGGVETFGLPITEAFEERGEIQQCFERVCLRRIVQQSREQVEIIPLGVVLTKGVTDHPAFAPSPPASRGAALYFPATGHNLSYQFRSFWETQGGHPRFGSPISEAFIERDKQTGQTRTVQYFERARLEYRLIAPGVQSLVQVGMLGREYVSSRKFPPSVTSSARPIRILGSSTIRFGPSSAYERNIRLAARQFDGLRVMPGEEVSFLNTVGELSADTGYVEAAGIVHGTISAMMAGGICYLSTAIFRSVFKAGLEILERHPHTLALAEFSTPPGMDAAVYMADGNGYRSNNDVDLRWRNDTDTPVVLVTRILSNTVLAVEIWGYEHGRKVQITNSGVMTTSLPAPIWQPDAHLAPCEVRVVAHSMPATRATIARIVTAADETLIHRDQLTSSYAGTHGLYRYGSGIIPLAGTDPKLVTIAEEQCRMRMQQAEQSENHAQKPGS